MGPALVEGWGDPKQIWILALFNSIGEVGIGPVSAHAKAEQGFRRLLEGFLFNDSQNFVFGREASHN